MWLEDCAVDLDYHLRRVQVPAPAAGANSIEVIGEIASTPLDRSRPLWEFHFAEGMADDRFALIGKVHHTLADGVASANLLARLMDLAGSAQDERDDYVTCDPPSNWQLLRDAQLDHFQQMAALPRLISDAARGITRVRERNKDAARTTRHGQDVSGAADVPQPRRFAGPDLRDRHAVAGRSQRNRQTSRRDVQRRRAGDGGRRIAGVAVAL